MRKDFFLGLCFSLLFFTLVVFYLTSKPKTREVESEALACNYSDLTGNIIFSDTTAFFEGQEVTIPRLAFETEKVSVLGTTNQERWIEVDLSEQKLYAWEGNSKFLETLISSGLPGTPTPKGEFRIWIKLRATKMEGGQGRNYYYLPNVPYVMYFGGSGIPNWKGYGLHGTYWHNDFGRPKSHGCVNLPTEIAKALYYWTNPVLPEGKNIVRSTDSDFGTKIVIHE